MFLRELPRALLRRWYLLILGLAATVFASYQVWGQIQPTYSAEASTLLLPPQSTTESASPTTGKGNPLLYLGGLGQARDALISALSSDAAQKEFERRFPKAEYAITPDDSSSAPIVVLSVEAPTPSAALAGTAYLASRVTQAIDQIQHDLAIDKKDQIRYMPLTSASQVTVNEQLRIRLTAAVAVGGVALTLLLAGLVDGLLAQRRRRIEQAKAARAAADEPSGSANGTEPATAGAAGDLTEAPDGSAAGTAAPDRPSSVHNAEPTAAEAALDAGESAVAVAVAAAPRHRNGARRHVARELEEL